MSRHIVAIFPRHPTSWSWLFEVARLLRDQPHLTPVVMLVTPDVAGYAAQCRDAGLQVLDLSEARQREIAAGLGRIGRTLGRCEDFFARHHRIANCLPVSLFRFVAVRRWLQAELRVFRAALSEVDPIALLTPGDRELSPVPAMLRAAKDVSVPIVNCSFASPWPEGLVLQRKGQPHFSTRWRDFPPLLNFIVKQIFPQQLHDGWILFSPGWLILAHASMRMLSEKPWVQGGGLSDYLLQNDTRRHDNYLAAGVAEKKLVFTGDPSLDSLYAAYREPGAIRKSLGMAPDGKVIMFSLPNDYEHGLCDLESHRTRLRSYLSVLSKCNAKTFVSLHPKADPGDYRELVTEYGLTLLSERLFNVLPAADLFIASNSSTIPWARLCGIPIVNVDYLGVREPEVAASETVGTPAAFERRLRELLSSPDEVTGNEALRAENLFDGQCGDRIVRFLSSLALRRTQQSASRPVPTRDLLIEAE